MDAFQPDNVVSSTTSPDMIVQDKPNPDSNQKIIIICSYIMFYIGKKNNMKRRSVQNFL